MGGADTVATTDAAGPVATFARGASDTIGETDAAEWPSSSLVSHRLAGTLETASRAFVVVHAVLLHALDRRRRRLRGYEASCFSRHALDVRRCRFCLHLGPAVADTLSTLDALQCRTRSPAISTVLFTRDDAVEILFVARSANDRVHTVESATAIRAFARIAADSISTSDGASVPGLLARSADDSIETSESASAYFRTSRAALDSLATVDSARSSLPCPGLARTSYRPPRLPLARPRSLERPGTLSDARRRFVARSRFVSLPTPSRRARRPDASSSSLEALPTRSLRTRRPRPSSRARRRARLDLDERRLVSSLARSLRCRRRLDERDGPLVSGIPRGAGDLVETVDDAARVTSRAFVARDSSRRPTWVVQVRGIPRGASDSSTTSETAVHGSVLRYAADSIFTTDQATGLSTNVRGARD